MKADPRLVTLIGGAGILSAWMTMAAVNCETDCADYSGVTTMTPMKQEAAPAPKDHGSQRSIAEVAFGDLN